MKGRHYTTELLLLGLSTCLSTFVGVVTLPTRTSSDVYNLCVPLIAEETVLSGEVQGYLTAIVLCHYTDSLPRAITHLGQCSVTAVLKFLTSFHRSSVFLFCGNPYKLCHWPHLGELSNVQTQYWPRVALHRVLLMISLEPA